jgi:hypothetical protein
VISSSRTGDIRPKGRETFGKVVHQAYKAAQFIVGYGGYGSSWPLSVEMGNAVIAKVCQAAVKLPIDGRIDAAILID